MMYNQNNLNIGNNNVSLPQLIETFGNENPRQNALLPQLYTERQIFSQKIPMLTKDKQYYSTSIKKAQRKSTLSNSKNTVRKPVSYRPSNQNISETLGLYGQLLREIFDKPLLLSPIYYNPAYKFLDPIVKLLTEALLSNQFDEAQEHILTNIMEDIMGCLFKENTCFRFCY